VKRLVKVKLKVTNKDDEYRYTKRLKGKNDGVQKPDVSNL